MFKGGRSPLLAQLEFFTGGGQPTNPLQWRHQKFSKKELFMVQRYRRIEDQKLWPGLAPSEDFAEGRGLEPKIKKSKCLNWEMC